MPHTTRPTVKRWSSSRELITDLANCDWKRWYADQRLRFAEAPLSTIITSSVGANTFRGFAHMPQRPSVVFRDWAYNALTQPGGHRDALFAVENRLDYDACLADLTESLRRHWEDVMDRQMSHGASRKLTNLLLKLVIAWSEIPAVRTAELVHYLHVPLDSFSIQALYNSLTAIPNGNKIGRIPSKASMSYIVDDARYQLFQNHIQSLAQAACVPPIALDLLAWDGAH